ncbi:MAG: Catechol 2,3-dioxygenase [Chloroflexi bacterium]|jgi:catechol 2,3-dioxygenase|nr:Catechol 2,3-dioxygenase [Chloroflexota bacterium]
MGVFRTGYVQLRVPDLAVATKYYTEVLGLVETDREADRVYLKGWDEHDHHSLILRQDAQPGLDHFALKTESPEDLGIFENKLEAKGIQVNRISAGEKLAQGEAISFEDRSGHRVEVYYSMKKVGNSLPLQNPDPFPPDLKGIAAPRMDHLLVTSPNAAEDLEFYRDVFGFRLTEQVVTPDGNPIAVWLERSHTPHDIAFIPGRPGGFHHMAYWLDNWNELGRAADVMAQNNVKIDAGPTRHGITRGHTIYFFDPCGNRNEVFTGGYVPDIDNPPITWSVDKLWTGIFYWDRSERGSFVEVYT